MKYLKDWHLMLVVLVFIVTDIIVLVIADSVEASRFVPTQRVDKELPQTVNVREVMTIVAL